jgi:hypothetical protein
LNFSDGSFQESPDELEDTKVRSFLKLVLICAFAGAVDGQDRHDWQSLAKLQAGDRIRLSLKTGPVEGTFQNWTPEQVTAGTIIVKREDVLKIDRYRRGASRGRHAAIGGLIGFGGGFAIGAAMGGCHPGQFGPCISRGAGGAAFGGVGAIIGAAIGALLPRQTREPIYSAR